MWCKIIIIIIINFFSKKFRQSFPYNETIPSYRHLHSCQNSYHNHGPIILDLYPKQRITKQKQVLSNNQDAINNNYIKKMVKFRL
jgi:hypothetical protein